MSKQKNVQDETVLRLRGLPWDASEADIADFFQGSAPFEINQFFRSLLIKCVNS